MEPNELPVSNQMPPVQHLAAPFNTGEVVPPPAEPENATRVAETPIELPRHINRAQAQAARYREQQEGFEWPLPKTGVIARVRDLTFVDKTLLGAIPAGARDFINQGIASGSIRGLASVGAEGMSIEKLIEVADAEEGLANAICIQGFIYPRLYMTEGEIPQVDPDAWLVSEISIQERRDYMHYVLANSTAEFSADKRRWGDAKSAGVASAPVVPDGGEGGTDAFRVAQAS